ncbi:MAG TPA: VOC family protein [Terriglobales bacterium]|nr:VOC family protein [Terriglobales bacterium]
MQVNPYLAYNGQCEEAFKLYEKVLNGKIVFMMRNSESPMADQTPPEQRNRIMHATLQVGDKVIMGADAPPQYYSKPAGFSVSISVSDPKEAERVFNALSQGGEVKMPLQKTFWAAAFGMFIDRFSIPWMVNCEGQS